MAGTPAFLRDQELPEPQHRARGWGRPDACLSPQVVHAHRPHFLALTPASPPQVVHAHRPHFLALHCQEFGGKNYEASMSHVDKFVK